MGFEIVRLDHVQLAMPEGREAEAEALLFGPPRIGAPPQTRAPGRAAGLLVRRWAGVAPSRRRRGLPAGPQGPPGAGGPRSARSGGGSGCGRRGGSAQPRERPFGGGALLHRRSLRQSDRAHRRGVDLATGPTAVLVAGAREAPAGTEAIVPTGVAGGGRGSRAAGVSGTRVCACDLGHRLALPEKPRRIAIRQARRDRCLVWAGRLVRDRRPSAGACTSGRRRRGRSRPGPSHPRP